MNMQVMVARAVKSDAVAVSVLVGELLSEIMQRVGVAAFNFDLLQTTEDEKVYHRKLRNKNARYYI